MSSDKTDRVSANVLEVIDKMMLTVETTLTKYGPAVADYTLKLVFYENLFILIAQLLTILVFYLMGKYFHKKYREWVTEAALKGPTFDTDAAEDILWIASKTPYVVCVGVGISVLAGSYKTFLALYDPKLYILHMAIKKVVE